MKFGGGGGGAGFLKGQFTHAGKLAENVLILMQSIINVSNLNHC